MKKRQSLSVIFLILAIIVVILFSFLVFKLYPFPKEEITEEPEVNETVEEEAVEDKDNGFCEDSDKGIFKHIRGTVRYTNKNFEFIDYCKSGKVLKEYYCKNEKSVSSKIFNCKKACINGICVV